MIDDNKILILKVRIIKMNDQMFNIILLLIPVIGAVITGVLVPYVKTKISAAQMDEITEWVTKAVQAAELLTKCSIPGKKLSLKIRFVFF